MKNSLDKKGLSLSQAQSVSNLCGQRASDIAGQIIILNNASKELTYEGKTYLETQGNPIPTDMVETILEKAKLHATQGFLMENIKAKDLLIKSIQNEEFTPSTPRPERPKKVFAEEADDVYESWGKDQLSLTEVTEFIYNEAHAAHIGQFFHKGSILEKLRTELPTMKTLEWIKVKEGEMTPLKVTVHHKPADLLDLHETLAGEHRKYEQKVNYIKAKIKNLVTLENARISKENAKAQQVANDHNGKVDQEFVAAHNAWSDNNRTEAFIFEEDRNKRISATAALRIVVPTLYQDTIDLFLSKLEKEE